MPSHPLPTGFRTVALTLISLTSLWAADSTTSQPVAASPAEATFKVSAAPVKINPMLLGSQFTFFDVAIFQKLEKDVLLNTWKEIPLHVLRYPGGTWADHYLWDNPAGSYFAAGDVNSVVSPERFIKACRAIGAEPIFQVNTGSKGRSNNNRINPTKLEDIQAGARNAANWVREANVNNNWNVKYWEIGNEVWIWLTPEEYALYVVEYSKAMKKADPSIKIIACGLSSAVGPFKVTWLNFKDDPNWKPRVISNTPEEWNKALFTIAKDSFDYYAPHPYLSPKDYDSKMPNKQVAVEVAKNPVPHYLASVASVWESEPLRKQQELPAKYNSTARMAVTEWNCNNGLSVPGSNSWNPKLYFYTLGNGLNNAHYFGRIVEGAAVTDIAVLHSLEDVQTFYYWPRKEMSRSTPIQSPIYLAMKIWGHHLGKQSLDMATTQVPKLKIGEKEYPSIYTYGSEDDAAVYIVAINFDPAAEHELVINLKDMKGVDSTATVTAMTGAEIDSSNFSSFNEENPPEVKLTTSSLAGEGGKWTVKMAAHSMVGIRIGKK